MPNQEFIEALGGNEIIEDVLGQIRKALQRDCNLRTADAYGRGYSGKVTLHLECFALDVASVDMAVEVHPTKEFLEAAPETPQDAEGTDVKVDVELDIPLVSDLKAVRDRSGQSEPETLVEPGQVQGQQRRSYGKPPTVGGAVDITD